MAIDSLATVPRLANDRDIGLAIQHRRDPSPHERMVVREQHPDGFVVGHR
jgi:hypothetical protein